MIKGKGFVVSGDPKHLRKTNLPKMERNWYHYLHLPDGQAG
jgi:hypothetical protein